MAALKPAFKAFVGYCEPCYCLTLLLKLLACQHFEMQPMFFRSIFFHNPDVQASLLP